MTGVNLRKYFGYAAIPILLVTLISNHTYLFHYGLIIGAILAILAPRGNSKKIAIIVLILCLLKLLLYILIAYIIVESVPSKTPMDYWE